MDDLKKLTLKSLLNYSAKKYSDRPALSFVSGTPISYSELRESVQELSKFLHYQGIIVGGKVAMASSFSKIHNIIEQQEPFKKTPTQKIKRYLYI